ncbi:bifunctional rhamnulose-1-phosphate aldolase/short-chain dehydrogenase [Nonomuraea sp. NBC_01738]|uniref:bifunctional rhamnulose-1-phosphate aldolase/short-chain dehydrogenase n=1 Tax=Nonomuraea sp. NBC_01738 TaxID=2976003 RepID=UPI002E124AE0|nr:bifunctional rhamnulose-1-phosphate aldolase/short-chain dehydrogenase [Nonomuraea sp. NBC_01738]
MKALLERAHTLGADRRNTNYAGGNASAKGVETDPVTGTAIELMWVKGSGGDLGTLTESGLAVLRLDRLRALAGMYPGVEREDEMVAAFDFCAHGKGGAAPSIDTAMHGLVDAIHVDHLHPDSGIAIATAADGPELTRRIFGDRVVWVPWRRPGFQLGLDIAAVKDEHPPAIGVILGGHGITAWGATAEECQANSLEIIRTAERFIAEHGKAEPFGPLIDWGASAGPDAGGGPKGSAIVRSGAAGASAIAYLGGAGRERAAVQGPAGEDRARGSEAHENDAPDANGREEEASGGVAGDGNVREGVARAHMPEERVHKEGSPRRADELSERDRLERAAALFPLIRGLASTDQRQVGHYNGDAVVLDFLARAEHPRLAGLGTSCPDHFLRTKVKPLVLDLPPDAPLEQVEVRLRDLHAVYRDDYRAYYDRHATSASPAMRGADPAIVLVPGVGMFSFGKDKQTARVAGEFYVNAINVMRGAEAVSSYAPIDEAEKFRIEYWELEEAKLRRMPPPKPLAGRVALVTGGGSGIGAATVRRLAAEGACVVIADRDLPAAGQLAASLNEAPRRSGVHAGSETPQRKGTAASDRSEVPTGASTGDVAAAVHVDVADEGAIRRALREAVLAFGGVDLVVNNAGLSISKSLLDTTVADWDLQHQVMARGSFLVSREAARVMIAQGLGGDIVYISSKNAVFAGPNNVAYGAAKADQAHQVRLLAAELGEHGIRVNGVNPDGVVRGSGIFAGGWGAQRAAVYGVPEEELGAFYARRTLLKREVLPEHVAAAVFALTGGDLTHTTGLHIPVDAGVAAAFLR